MLGKILLLLDEGGGLREDANLEEVMKKGRCEEAPNASVGEAPKLRGDRFSYTNPHTKTVTSSQPTTIYVILPKHRHVLDLSGIMQAWRVSRTWRWSRGVEGCGLSISELFLARERKECEGGHERKG